MLQSFSMMLRYSFDQGIAADLLDQASGRVLADGLRAADIMQDGMARVSTSTMGEAIVRELDKARRLTVARRDRLRRAPAPPM